MKKIIFAWLLYEDPCSTPSVTFRTQQAKPAVSRAAKKGPGETQLIVKQHFYLQCDQIPNLFGPQD